LTIKAVSPARKEETKLNMSLVCLAWCAHLVAQCLIIGYQLGELSCQYLAAYSYRVRLTAVRFDWRRISPTCPRSCPCASDGARRSEAFLLRLPASCRISERASWESSNRITFLATRSGVNHPGRACTTRFPAIKLTIRKTLAYAPGSGRSRRDGSKR